MNGHPAYAQLSTFDEKQSNPSGSPYLFPQKIDSAIPEGSLDGAPSIVSITSSRVCPQAKKRDRYRRRNRSKDESGCTEEVKTANQ
jgi:hypothetical protein